MGNNVRLNGFEFDVVRNSLPQQGNRWLALSKQAKLSADEENEKEIIEHEALGRHLTACQAQLDAQLKKLKNQRGKE